MQRARSDRHERGCDADQDLSRRDAFQPQAEISVVYELATAFSLEGRDAALDAFDHAENYQSQAKDARGWVKYVLVTRGQSNGQSSEDD